MEAQETRLHGPACSGRIRHYISFHFCDRQASQQAAHLSVHLSVQPLDQVWLVTFFGVLLVGVQLGLMLGAQNLNLFGTLKLEEEEKRRS